MPFYKTFNKINNKLLRRMRNSPKGERELNGEGYMNKMKKQVGKYVCNLIIKVTEIFLKNLNWQKMIEEKIWVIITNKYLKIILFAVIQKMRIIIVNCFFFAFHCIMNPLEN